MCIGNCASIDIHEKFPVPAGKEQAGIRYKPKTGLFNWITILLIISWVLVVAVAATNIQADKASGDQSVRVFIQGMI